MSRPDAVASVAANSGATSSWANDVADGINAIADDIYGPAPGDQLELPWASLTGVPSTFTPASHAASHATGGGDALALPWADITGKPSTFTPATHASAHATGGGDAMTPANIGAWAKLSAGGGVAGVTIHVGTTAPSSPAEGDVWIKG